MRWLISLSAAALLAAAPAFAQSAKPMPTDLYGDPAHSNLSGWWAKDMPRFSDMKPPPEQTPKYAAFRAKVQAMLEAGTPIADHSSECQAFGLPWFLTMGMEVIQTPGRVTMATEALHEVRRIYTDGRGHPPDLDPSFVGHSIGHWEGDTLVVETAGLRAAYIDSSGYSHSDKLTAVERIRRESVTELSDELTLTDPEALVRPWTAKLRYQLVDPKEEIQEYICTENLRNRTTAEGTQGVEVDRGK